MGKKRPAFKPYHQNQLTFLPYSLEELIPEGHIVRVVNDLIDQIDTRALFNQYEGGGASSFNPIMMLKVIIYAYTQKTFSCRGIAKGCRENVMFMWLSGMNTPDYKTINRFRSERMKTVILDVFSNVVALLHSGGHIQLEHYFLDGTKIESSAGKYSWVWGKNTKRFKEKLREKCTELFDQIEALEQDESKTYGDEDLPELRAAKDIDSAAIRNVTEKINKQLESTPTNKTLKKAKKLIEGDYLPRMEKYEEQERILENRRSYSKKDHDATFMRMKEDHMKNGQLKPGYNVQIGTENQFIIGYSIHQRPSDTSCFKEHMEKAKAILGKLPENIVADAGYGSEENYEYLEAEQLTGYVKYNTFHKEASRKWKKDVLKVQNWTYDETGDFYVCGYGRPLVFAYEKKQKSDNGYKSMIRVYESKDCSECPYRDKCVKSVKPDAVRRIYINRRLNELKKKARENLTSEKGIQMRKRRCIEVETAFGDIKGNLGMRRFALKGLEKTSIEWGLISLAHNMRKLALKSA